MRRSTRLLALLPALALAISLSACAESTKPVGKTAGGISVVEPGKLTTCTHLDYEPFQYREAGKTIGFDVDLVDLIAKDMGLQQKIKDTPFEGITSGEDLNTNKCDIGAAAMSITPTRQQNMDFSDPYFEATQALAVKKNSPVDGLSDLRDKTVGVQLGTTGEEFANEQRTTNGYTVRQFEDLPLEITALETDQIAGAINDNSVLAHHIKGKPDIEIVKEFKTGDQYGIGVRKGNTALLNKINESLRTIKENGEYDRIYQKWFGKKPPQDS